jgi:predicted nucleic acid-binding protein
VIAVDTSVAVAAALPWHEAHAVARSALPAPRPALIGQVAVETYSVLTRLRPPQRVPPAVARAYLAEAFASPPIVLAAEAYEHLLDLAVTERIAGGAVYDAIVGATARDVGATLLTLDRRAVPTYERVGVTYRLLV